jgi:hypothetical protein
MAAVEDFLPTTVKRMKSLSGLGFVVGFQQAADAPIQSLAGVFE